MDAFSSFRPRCAADLCLDHRPTSVTDRSDSIAVGHADGDGAANQSSKTVIPIFLQHQDFQTASPRAVAEQHGC